MLTCLEELKWHLTVPTHRLHDPPPLRSCLTIPSCTQWNSINHDISFKCLLIQLVLVSFHIMNSRHLHATSDLMLIWWIGFSILFRYLPRYSWRYQQLNILHLDRPLATRKSYECRRHVGKQIPLRTPKRVQYVKNYRGSGDIAFLSLTSELHPVFRVDH